MTMVLTIFIKYVLHSIDLQNENPWDSKAVYMLYTELFTGTPSSRRPFPSFLPDLWVFFPLKIPFFHPVGFSFW